MLLWGVVVFGLILGAKVIPMEGANENPYEGANETPMEGPNAITIEELKQKLQELENRLAATEKQLGGLEELENRTEKQLGGLQDLENRVAATEKQLEYGGKRFGKLLELSEVQLKDRDYIKLQFLGAKDAWLGCPSTFNGVCDIRTCSNYGQYRYFDGRCYGEDFQIINEGLDLSPIKSGQRIRIRYLHEHNTWLSCREHANNHCNKKTCSGTTAQGKDFTNNRCWGEVFIIYARGRRNGDIIYNGDFVMLYYRQLTRYVTIQGEQVYSDTSLNNCPGEVPPAYLSYSICSKNVFRIYRKP